MRILIIDQLHEAILKPLKTKGHSVDYLPNITLDELRQELPTTQGLILRSKIRLETSLLSLAPNLRFIARAGAGVDEIDESYLQENNIVLLNAPEGNRDAVGEHTLGMLLCLMNQLNLADLEVREKHWRREENRGHEIKGRTIGIIGYGNMGKAFAQRLKGFECKKVIAYDKLTTGYADGNASEVSLEHIMEEADIVSFHIPLNAENRNWVTPAFLDRFRKPIYLLNLARGEVIPFASIRYGLEKGILRGAGLDVLENEKLNTLTPEQKEHFDWLATSKKVLFTPHVGGWTFESYRRISEVLAQKINDRF